MTRTGLAAAVFLALLLCERAAAKDATWVRLPPTAPALEAEVADEVRPVFRDVEKRDDGSFAAATPLLELPPGSRVESWVAIAAEPGPAARGGGFRFTVGLEAEDGERRQLAALDVDAASAARGWQRLQAALPGEQAVRARLIVAATPLAGEPSPGAARASPSPERPLLGTPIVFSAKRAAPPRNVILVSLDTLRADRLSSYGADRATTPRIDRLAAAGVRFDVALAPSASTPPSHMTLLTGTLPCRHGVWGVHVEDRVPDDIPTLGELLRANGYLAAAITENAYVGAPYGFARGFDSFVEQKGSGRSDDPDVAYTPTGLGPATFAAARDWIRHHAEDRFFLFVHTYQMHGPRRPPAPYATLFPEATERPQGPDWNPEFHDLARYDRLLRQADDLVGELIDTLTALDLADETLLVLTSDHGEAFLEHGDHGHGTSLWEEIVRVPLVLWAPGRLTARVVREPVGLVDVVPTVLGLLGIAPPPGLDGRSAMPPSRQADADAAARVFYMETAPGNARAVRDARYKIIRSEDGRELVFDLAGDPAEQRPLGDPPAGAARERLSRLRTELDRREAECRAQRDRAAVKRTGTGRLDPARREKLRALGYAE